MSLKNLCLLLAAFAMTSGLSAAPAPDEARRLAPSWQAPLRDTSDDIVHAGGAIYYIETDAAGVDRIVRRDAKTGVALPFADAELPQLLLPARLKAVGDTLYVLTIFASASERAALSAYTLAGKRAWTSPFDGRYVNEDFAVAGPVVASTVGKVCAGDTGTEDECIDTEVQVRAAATGRLLWAKAVGGRATGAEVVVAGGTVAVSTLSNGIDNDAPQVRKLTGLALADGRQLWRRRGVSGGHLATEGADVYTSGAAICAWRAADGARRWCKAPVADADFGAIIFAADRLYVNVSQGEGARTAIAAVDPNRGRLVWQEQVKILDQGERGMAVANGVLYVHDHVGNDWTSYLVALRADSGAALGRVKVSDGLSHSKIAVADGGLAVIDQNYQSKAVRAFAPRPAN